VPGLLEAVQATQQSNPMVNAVLARTTPTRSPAEVAEDIRRWRRLTVYTREQMERILIGQLIATSAKQIGMFLVILALVSAAIIAFIIYTLTMGKIREIAVLKLIGTKDRTIAAMIVQQAMALGLIGFVVGKIAATFWAPFFPKHVLLEPGDAVRGLLALLAICLIASLIAIRAALRVDPAEAIGG
jgi:putative ABC transport system permease protein